MSYLFDYIKKYGNLHFEELPLNVADFMVLSQISYWPFEVFDAKHIEGKLLKDASYNIYENSNFKSSLKWFKQIKKLNSIIDQYTRYSNLKIDKFSASQCSAEEKQFAAITFNCDDFAIVVFRGTDLSIEGWKENFNLSYMHNVPAQKDALDYLNATCNNYKKIFICGHSKGGNLALYSATNCSFQECIYAVYVFDGNIPLDNISETKGWKNIEDRIYSYVPSQSLVSVVTGYGLKSFIIKAKGFGIGQHNVFNWCFKDKTLMLAEKLSKTSAITYELFHDAYYEMDQETKETSIRAIYKLVDVSGATQVDKLIWYFVLNFPKILKTNNNFSNKEKRALQILRKRFIRSFLTIRKNQRDIKKLKKKLYKNV